MNLKPFIERPVLSTVISIIIVLLGLLGYFALPVTSYPDIAPPSVSISASYPGANAETVLESVITPIEEEVNGVEGMTYISSTANNDGGASINVFFEPGTDPDIAAVNVQNRVSRATANVPAEVNRTGISVRKQQNSAIMYALLRSKNPNYDQTFIQNYINIHIKPDILRINGVGNFSIFGGNDYSMRIWISPEKMTNYNLSISDITNAIGQQSQEVSAGSLGQNSGQAFEYVIKYKGRYNDVKEYENIILRARDDGSYLYLKDVANIELGAFSYSGIGQSDGYPGVPFGIFQTPGSNAQKIAEQIYTEFDKMREKLPEGMEININYDTNKFLTASFNKVKKTILEAFILVFIVVFIFLQSFRSTIIPAIAVPVAIIGTFFFLDIVGFSLNLLTLFALILAVGIVVDDAIVVVEAIHSKLEGEYDDPKEASIAAMKEISGAIISITLVMAAVFIPVTFIEGPTGVFYKQFGITLIVAILISALNALTLSPALCAILLRPHNKSEKKTFGQKFFSGFNIGFSYLTKRYIHSLRFLFRKRWIVVVLLVIAACVIYISNKNLPKGFVPNEDQGVMFMNIELPKGASLERTHSVAEELGRKVRQIEGVNSYTEFSGVNFFSGSGSSFALGFISLDDWKERKKEHLNVKSIIGQAFAVASTIPDAQIVFFTPGSVPGYGSSNGVEAQLLDQSSGSFDDLSKTASDFTQALMARPELSFVSNSFSTSFPQYQLDINIAKAQQAGVMINDLLYTIQGFIGGIYATDFNKFGKQYRVFVQSEPDDRKDISSLNSMHVRNSNGEMAPITEFVSLKRVYGPQSINRFNLYNAVTLNGNAAPGYSSGQAIKAFQEVAEETLPSNYDITFSGLSKEEIDSGNQSLLIFILSLLFIYFLLSAQYESYLLPFSVILSLLIGVAGSYFIVLIAGLENNIFFQIALIMLIGLLAKNAILIVEISLQKRKSGKTLVNAALEGAKSRLRPILMTSFAFIIGLAPLVFAQGVSSAGNHSIGTGAAGGMLIGTLIGIFVIPSLFVAFQYLHEKVANKFFNIKKK
ncbi:MAG: efflux RND transporter permease subunit [Hyphomicrobiales bacterium]